MTKSQTELDNVQQIKTGDKIEQNPTKDDKQSQKEIFDKLPFHFQVLQKFFDILQSPFTTYKPLNKVSLKDIQNVDINNDTINSKFIYKKKEEIPVLSMAEVQKMHENSQVVLIINDYVYDVTKWQKAHPGGEQILQTYSGADVSDAFYAFHRPRVVNRLEKFLIGRLDQQTKTSKQGELYRKLRKYLWENKYFDADSIYYDKKYICLVLLFTVSLLLALNQNYILAAIILAQFIKQGAYIAHDSLHYCTHAQTPNSNSNLHGTFFGSVIFGISSDMWNIEHTMHHAITRRPLEDPQFNYLPFMLISPKEITWKGYKLNFLTKIMLKAQHFYYIPLCLIVGRFNLYIISLISLVKRQKWMDLLCMILYFTWFISFVNIIDGTYQKVIFVLLNHFVVGILHVQLLINHLGVDAFTTEEEREMDFFTFQVKTTRNTKTQWWENWFHGGLQWQIEHHLFPELPRHNLRLIKPAIEEICKEAEIEYREEIFFKSINTSSCSLQELAKEVAAGNLG